MLWRRYRQRRGTLNLGMRIDTAAARVLCVQFNSKSKSAGFEIADFSPFADRLPEQDASIEQAFGMLDAIAKSAASK